jgi:hypothetical protein
VSPLKIKISSKKLGRHRRAEGFKSDVEGLSTALDENGWFISLAVLSPGPTEENAGWVPEPVWSVWGRNWKISGLEYNDVEAPLF